MFIELNAMDTLFFGSGRPYNMGSDSWTNSIFPPLPSVFYGALRSCWFSYNQEMLCKANSSEDPTLNLKIHSIYIKIGDDLYYPAPADCIALRSEKAQLAYILKVRKKTTPSCFPLNHMLAWDSEEQVESMEGMLFDNISVKQYLAGANNRFPFEKMTDFVLSEVKIGIARSRRTHAAQEHMLYRIDLRRLAPGDHRDNRTVSLVVKYEGLDLPETGIMRIGGEGKAVSYKHIPLSLEYNPSLFVPYFKIYFVTPAVFEQGWLPRWLSKNGQNYEGVFQGLRLRLITAAVGKMLPVGGFDIKHRRSKPMRRAIPAGSVYYFEMLSGQPEQAIAAFHNKNITDYDEYNQQGFGFTMIGGYSL